MEVTKKAREDSVYVDVASFVCQEKEAKASMFLSFMQPLDKQIVVSGQIFFSFASIVNYCTFNKLTNQKSHLADET